MSDPTFSFADAWRVLDYDPKTGVFTRKVRLAQRHQAGDRADLLITSGGAKGYRRVSLFSQRVLAHRLAIFMVTGEWPGSEVDHRDSDKCNNAFSNLRVAGARVNAENRRSPTAANRLGVLGVYEHTPGVYRSRLQVRGRTVHIGLFKDPAEAHQAYVAAKRRLHEGCTL